MPQISGPNSQENRIIETCKEEGGAVSTQETAAPGIGFHCSTSKLIRGYKEKKKRPKKMPLASTDILTTARVCRKMFVCIKVRVSKK
jgi:hypothetical protein